jgi:branched-chain amino acid transport system substrate-binding protein
MDDNITRRAALGRIAKAGAAVTLGPGLLAACGGNSGSSTAAQTAASGKTPTTPIKVGILTDLTGPYAIVGKSNQAVAEFAIGEINAAGGISGRRIEPVVVDSASDPAAAAKVAAQLVTQDKVDMVIGGVTSATREAIKGIIATRGETLYLWPASYEGGECDEHVWNSGAVPNQQISPIVDYVLSKGAKTFYLCGNDYIYPRNILKQVKVGAAAGGAKIVGEEYVPVNISDTSGLVNKVLASGADVLFEIIILPATAPFIKGVVEGGFKGLIASSLFDEGITPLFGKDAQGLLSAQDYFHSIKDPFTVQKVAQFSKKYPKAIFASTFNAPAWYRGLHLWAKAVEQAGSADLSAVDKAMNTVSSSQLIGGSAAFDAGTRHCRLPMYLGQMLGNGTVKVLNSNPSVAPEGQCT